MVGNTITLNVFVTETEILYFAGQVCKIIKAKKSIIQYIPEKYLRTAKLKGKELPMVTTKGLAYLACILSFP